MAADLDAAARGAGAARPAAPAPRRSSAPSARAAASCLTGSALVPALERAITRDAQRRAQRRAVTDRATATDCRPAPGAAVTGRRAVLECLAITGCERVVPDPRTVVELPSACRDPAG